MKVPCDPAQVIVNHASFRVRLGGDAPVPGALDDTTPMPVIPTSVRSAAEARVPGRRRSAPVVWSGRTGPDDAAATRLLQAVHTAGGTEMLPLPDGGFFGEDLDDGMPPVRPVVVTPRAPASGDALRAQRGPFGHPGSDLRHGAGAPPAGEGRAAGAGYPYQDAEEDTPRQPYAAFGLHGPHPAPYDLPLDGGDYRLAGGPETAGGLPYGGYPYADEDEADPREQRVRRRSAEPVRHAWYPGRRMNLGVVLLPLRVFLGFISIYAGMGKLCDPVYFDGGHRGSMVHWLSALHPWTVAEPLRAAALAHPVGAGLTVAFLQVVVGVLTIGGLWQRVAAGAGAALSTALLVTVSWRSVPAYDAPHIVYLAAWSPLAIAGAPAYSIDAKLAGEAWRRLGPRAPLWELRRYVLRRGLVLATVVAGGSLVVGALFGSAVRASQSRPGIPVAPPSPVPTNNLPGSPLPELPGTGGSTGPTPRPHQPRPARSAASPSQSSNGVDSPTAPPAAEQTAGSPGSGMGSGTVRRHPSQQQTVQAPQQSVTAPHSTAPANSTAPGGSGSGGSLGGLLGSKPPTGWLLGMPGGRRTPPGGVA